MSELLFLVKRVTCDLRRRVIQRFGDCFWRDVTRNLSLADRSPHLLLANLLRDWPPSFSLE